MSNQMCVAHERCGTSWNIAKNVSDFLMHKLDVIRKSNTFRECFGAHCALKWRVLEMFRLPVVFQRIFVCIRCGAPFKFTIVKLPLFSPQMCVKMSNHVSTRVRLEFAIIFK